MPSLSFLSFTNVLLVSIVLRITLILYSEWHDARSVVKYTDVDYRVFSDAAAFLLHPGPGDANRAQGPWAKYLSRWVEFGDPYTRETYRYTPLLALVLTPNGWLHPSFGKYIFALCDILNGVIIYQLLKTEILPQTQARRSTTPAKATASSSQADTKSPPPSSSSVPPATEATSSHYSTSQLATLYSAVHLLNPLVFSISTRGSSESVLSLFVLGTLYAALKGRWDACALLLGLSTHWKIYPVVYGVSCLCVVGGGWRGSGSGRELREGRKKMALVLVKSLVNWKTVRFTVVSAGTFFLLGAGCYAVWGTPFLYESYLYHLDRLDHRHNFSPYFYVIYLLYPVLTAPRKVRAEWGLLAVERLGGFVVHSSFITQMFLALPLGLLFGMGGAENLAFTWFVQTVVFVVFNKVCTSQYFLWYLLLLPLLLPQLRMSRVKAIACVAVWIGTQALWLSYAYQLEFLGQNVFFTLWVCSLMYVVGNCWVLVQIMQAYASGKEGLVKSVW